MVCFINQKREAGKAVKYMITELENMFNSRIETLHCLNRSAVKWRRSDGGGEYIGDHFQLLLKQKGIVHEITMVCSSVSNRRAERLNRTLIDMGIAMMRTLGAHRRHLWAEVIDTACFIRK